MHSAVVKHYTCSFFIELAPGLPCIVLRVSCSCSQHYFPLFNSFQLAQVSHASSVANFSRTSTTGTDISSTHDALITATGSSHAACATAPSTNATVCAFTCCTCTRSTAPISATCATRSFPSRPVLKSTCECTAARNRTSVHTVSRPSLRPPFYARTFDNTAARNHSNASTAAGCSPRTRRMTATCVARIKQHARVAPIVASSSRSCTSIGALTRSFLATSQTKFEHFWCSKW